jgi:phage baseplate assembly protein W
MKTITVSNGDINLVGGKLEFSYGSNKLAQDITLWLQEPLGTGFTTPGFGSLLSGMVGTSQANNSASSVENEIMRVLQLYQGQQVLSLRQAQNSAQLSIWNKNEIIQKIVSVTANVNSNNGTEIDATVVIQTLTGSLVTLLASINSNGVTVQNG